jgi:hypothetical protein
VSRHSACDYCGKEIPASQSIGALELRAYLAQDGKVSRYDLCQEHWGLFAAMIDAEVAKREPPEPPCDRPAYARQGASPLCMAHLIRSGRPFDHVYDSASSNRPLCQWGRDDRRGEDL